MKWLIEFFRKLFKVESKQEYAYKLTINFIKQFGFDKNSKEELNFFYILFLEWGKTKNGMKNLYEFLNHAYIVFSKLLRAQEGTLKSIDPDVVEASKNKKHVFKLMEFSISKAENKTNFEKTLEAIDKEEVLNNSLPSVIIRFLIPLLIDNINKIDMRKDLSKFANVIDFYRSIVNQEIMTFLENVFGTYLNIYIAYKNDIETFAMETIQDFPNFIENFKEDKETVKVFIKNVASSYILFHINVYHDYSEEFREYFGSLLKNLKTRYKEDEALLQAVLMVLPLILKLSNSLNDITMFVQMLDEYIVDFIEIAKSEQVQARLKENKMFFYASKKVKRDIYTAEALLINYVAYALPTLLETCKSIELFEYCKTLVKELMSTFMDVEIGFYYVYVVLPRWLKADKDQDKIYDMHEKLKRLLYPLQKDVNELVRFFYFDFKDYMV